jgi:PTH1 family peptidyl-tRNA hydrolase
VDGPTLRLIVGLGNPGRQYRRHRHNLGFRVVEEVARRLGLVFGTTTATFTAAADRSSPPGVVLLKPLAYMNRSGQALRDWARTAGVAVTGRPPAADPDPEGTGGGLEPTVPVRPLVVCDDLNLPLGSVRLRPEGSSGGQNGLASVIEHLGGQHFPRLRLGIAPGQGEIDPRRWADFVLADFAPDELAVAADLVDHAAAAVIFWLDHGLEDTVSRYNRRIRPAQE